MRMLARPAPTTRAELWAANNESGQSTRADRARRPAVLQAPALAHALADHRRAVLSLAGGFYFSAFARGGVRLASDDRPALAGASRVEQRLLLDAAAARQGLV